jgi:drug/metabolite transporter (DMT)-like permease
MNQRAVWAVLTAATMAGSSGVFVKNMEMPVTSMGFFRALLPSLLMGGAMLAHRTPFFRGNYRLMIGVSVINVLRMYFFFTAFRYTSMGNAILISYTWPIFVNIFSALFLKEIISRRNIVLLTLAFTGIVVVYSNQPFSFENRDFIGMSAALGMALIYALTVVAFKKESDY